MGTSVLPTIGEPACRCYECDHTLEPAGSGPGVGSSLKSQSAVIVPSGVRRRSVSKSVDFPKDETGSDQKLRKQCFNFELQTARDFVSTINSSEDNSSEDEFTPGYFTAKLGELAVLLHPNIYRLKRADNPSATELTKLKAHREIHRICEDVCIAAFGWLSLGDTFHEFASPDSSGRDAFVQQCKDATRSTVSPDKAGSFFIDVLKQINDLLVIPPAQDLLKKTKNSLRLSDFMKAFQLMDDQRRSTERLIWEELDPGFPIDDKTRPIPRSPEGSDRSFNSFDRVLLEHIRVTHHNDKDVMRMSGLGVLALTETPETLTRLIDRYVIQGHRFGWKPTFGDVTNPKLWETFASISSISVEAWSSYMTLPSDRNRNLYRLDEPEEVPIKNNNLLESVGFCPGGTSFAVRFSELSAYRKHLEWSPLDEPAESGKPVYVELAQVQAGILSYALPLALPPKLLKWPTPSAGFFPPMQTKDALITNQNRGGTSLCPASSPDQ